MMDEMNMALEMISAIENLSLDEFIAEYNRMFNKNIIAAQVKWTGFPVYYDPED